MRAAGRGEEKERGRENTRGSVSLTNPSIETARMKCLLVLGKEAQWSGATSKRTLKQLAAFAVSLAATLCFPRALSCRDESLPSFPPAAAASLPAGIPSRSTTRSTRFRNDPARETRRILFGYSFVTPSRAALRKARLAFDEASIKPGDFFGAVVAFPRPINMRRE